MKVICFRGKSNTGKSTIIKKILNEVYNIKLIPDKRDFSLIFEYNRKKIGICSYGDTLDALKKYLKPLINANCDIIICACHTKGGTLRFIMREFSSLVRFIECKRVEKDRLNDKIRNKVNEFRKVMST
jgi:predicted kinase